MDVVLSYMLVCAKLMKKLWNLHICLGDCCIPTASAFSTTVVIIRNIRVCLISLLQDSISLARNISSFLALELEIMVFVKTQEFGPLIFLDVPSLNILVGCVFIKHHAKCLLSCLFVLVKVNGSLRVSSRLPKLF